MRLLCALLAGLLFGSGLLLSGMSNPANVLAFLDVTGHWQPALLFTMAAAVAIAAPAYLLAHSRPRALLGEIIAWPERYHITPRLVAGSAIFGIGWGLSGVCPGPGLLLLTRPQWQALVFFVAMAAGLLLSGLRSRRSGPRTGATAQP